MLGLVLGGSRGKGAHVTDESDWDVYVVVRERPRDWQFTRGGRIEPFLMTLDELRDMPDWNRYAFAHVQPVLDKTGGAIADVVAALGRRDSSTANERLEAWGTSRFPRPLHRSASRTGAPRRLDFVFAAHGRVRPYNKWLRWELIAHPLDEPWSVDNVVPRLSRIVATGDIAEQRALFRATEAFARDRGFGAVIDGWEPDVTFLRG